MPTPPAPTIKRKLSYPITRLERITGINTDSLIELSVHTGDAWESRKTTVNDLGNYIITAHPIFNNLQSLFNTVDNAITFLNPTYFINRPYVRHDRGDGAASNELKTNAPKIYNLVTLYDVKERIRRTGIAVQAVGPSSIYKRWQISPPKWSIVKQKPAIIVDEGYMQPIYSKDKCPDIDLVTYALPNNTTIHGYGTVAPIVCEKDMMVHIIANLRLDQPYSALVDPEEVPAPYHLNSLNNWMAILFDGGEGVAPVVGSISTFSEIFEIGDDLAVAQVQMTMPIGKGVAFNLFTPANLNTDIPEELENDFRLNRSIFNGLNQVHISYFDENTEDDDEDED